MKNDESPLNFFHQTAKREPSDNPQKQHSATALNKEIQQTNHMMSQIYEMQKKIEEELENLIKVSGFSKEQIWQLLEHPHNFKTDQWEKTQAHCKDLREKIRSALTIDASDLAAPQARTQTKEQHRKAKFTGARRNWLSAR